ncbi:hypothetical protein OUZ56_009502 [Daphnia magna]|uniref:FLYWCH-type domain-containing protein n=1 Tax=Daphnia magna TaxID=35525 RepID=A0ABR0AGB3_9CRUS|nr:hypothetical protein OUZ56_009502 [Daphnia magna]
MDVVVAVRQVPGERKGGFHYVTADNFIFHRYKRSAQSEYFRCRKYESFGCLARLRQTDHQYFKTGSEHNHENETEEIRKIAVVNECVKYRSDYSSFLRITYNV